MYTSGLIGLTDLQSVTIMKRVRFMRIKRKPKHVSVGKLCENDMLQFLNI